MSKKKSGTLAEYQTKDNFLWVNFNAPNVRNALSLEQARELASKVDQQKPKGLLLSATGPVFCSGGQLKDYAAHPQNGVVVNREIAQILKTLYELPIPKCVVVDGGCFGGGVELTTVFDRVLATPRAQFALWQRRIGLSFGWGGEERLSKRIGFAALKEWYITTNLKSSYGAHRLGLVDEVVSSERGVRVAFQWLQASSSFSEWALAAFVDPQCNEEETFAKLWLNIDHKKALAPYSP